MLQSCEKCRLPFHAETKLLTEWQGLLEENLSYQEASVRSRAADAFSYMVAEYYVDNPNIPGTVEEFLVNFAKTLSATVLVTRMGYSLALGKLSHGLYSSRIGLIILFFVSRAVS